MVKLLIFLNLYLLQPGVESGLVLPLLSTPLWVIPYENISICEQQSQVFNDRPGRISADGQYYFKNHSICILEV